MLQMYSCVAGDTILSSNSWKDVTSHRQCATEFELILFVSHRWEYPNNPDPNGRQYEAVQKIIQYIVLGVRTFEAMESGEHHKHLQDLGQHGVLQGAMIASRLLANLSESLETTNKEKRDATLSTLAGCPERLIGVWYDAACLPQGELSIQTRLEFQEALKSLPKFVQHKNVCVIALREAEDDYEQRGWCMMEFMLASQQSIYNPLIYRLDKDKKPLLINNQTSSGKIFNGLLNHWLEAKADTAFKIWQAVVIQANALPDAITTESDVPALSLRTALLQFALVQSGLFIAKKHNEPMRESLDILTELQKQSGLLTTLPEDGVLTYLMILIGGCTSDNPQRKEFETSLNQLLHSSKQSRVNWI